MAEPLLSNLVQIGCRMGGPLTSSGPLTSEIRYTE